MYTVKKSVLLVFAASQSSTSCKLINKLIWTPYFLLRMRPLDNNITMQMKEMRNVTLLAETKDPL